MTSSSNTGKLLLEQPFPRDSCDILTKNNILLVPNLYNNYSGLVKLWYFVKVVASYVLAKKGIDELMLGIKINESMLNFVTHVMHHGIVFPDSVAFGSFCVKSPNELNPTVSDFNETWYTCCLGTHSTKSKNVGQSDQWCGRYGPPNFESFGKNGHGCHPLNPHISGTSGPIFIKLVFMDRQFDKDSRYVILVQIGECLGALTCWPLLWPWNWPCGSRDS